MSKRFEDIEVCQKSRELCKRIFTLLSPDKFSKDFALTNQLNRSLASIMDNIAEGFEKNNNKEFINFLFIAKGSAGEVSSQSYRAFERDYILTAEFDYLKEEVELISKQLGNFIDYLKSAEIKGYKHLFK